jgi:integrase
MTFKELSEWYLDLAKVKSRAYPTLLTNFKTLNRILGTMIVKEIKPTDLENYQAKRKAERPPQRENGEVRDGYSDAYIDHEITAAKAMINKAFDNEKVCGDTLKRFRNVERLLENRNANARDKILTLGQLKVLMEKLPAHTKPIIAMGFWTGMRRGEIVRLTWDKVDLKGRMIRLEAADTKDKEPRKVPIANSLCEILRNIPRAIHENHVFLYDGKPLKGIRRSLKTGCTSAEITYGRFGKDGFIFHDLRHSFNTYMRKAGVAQSVIMAITGHAQNSMFDRYNTIDNDDLLTAIDQFEDYIKSVDQTVDQKEKRANL